MNSQIFLKQLLLSLGNKITILQEFISVLKLLLTSMLRRYYISNRLLSLLINELNLQMEINKNHFFETNKCHLYL